MPGRNKKFKSAVWGETTCPPGREEQAWSSDLDIRLSVYRWRGGGEVVINKHWADVQLRSASMCVYVCVCSLSRCGCQQDHRCGRYATAVSAPHLLQPSEQQIACSHGFLLRAPQGKHDVSTLKYRCFPLRPWAGLPHLSTEPLHWFSLLIYGLKFLLQQQ